jgi:hypothetical protein
VRPELPDAVRRLRDDLAAVRLELEVVGAADARRARDCTSDGGCRMRHLVTLDLPAVG